MTNGLARVVDGAPGLKLQVIQEYQSRGTTMGALEWQLAAREIRQQGAALFVAERVAEHRGTSTSLAVQNVLDYLGLHINTCG